MHSPDRVAVIIACLDEAATIGAVVSAFRAALPSAHVYVYDNGSTDSSAEHARAAGAVVRCVTRRGKGRLLRRAFADIDADRYVIVDGDGTYAADSAATLLALVAGGAEMAVASRRASYAGSGSRPGHDVGNRLVTWMVNVLFGEALRDVLSGYRVLDGRFAKTLPALAQGFEVEIAMTMHALEIGADIVECESVYSPRPAGSHSKLRTVRDGLGIVWTLLSLARQARPLLLFGGAAIALATLGLLLGLPVVGEFVETGRVPRFPTAILAAALEILAGVSLSIGLVLDSVAASRRELKRIAFQVALRTSSHVERADVS